MEKTITARLKKKLESAKSGASTELPKTNSAASTELLKSNSAASSEMPKSNSAASISAKIALKEAVKRAKKKVIIDNPPDATEIKGDKRYYWDMKKRGTKYRPWEE